MASAYEEVVLLYTDLAGNHIPVLQIFDTVTCFIESKDLDFGAEEIVKFLQALYFSLQGSSQSPNLKVIVKWRNSQEEPLQSSAPVAIASVGPTFVKVPGAKFYRIRVEDTGVRVLWKLARIEPWGATGGRW